MKRGAGTYDASALPPWQYLGGEMLTMDGTQKNATIPSEATIVEIRARGGAVYFNLNGTVVSGPPGPGYIPQDGGEILGPLDQLNSLPMVGAAGAFAHLLYFREV